MALKTRNNKEVIRRSCDAINERDRETFLTLSDPEIRHRQGSEEVHGAETVTAQVWAFIEAFPDVILTPETIIAEDDMVAMQYTLSGTHRGTFYGIEPTGKEFSVSEMKFYRITDGKIADVWATPDLLGMLAQLDVIETPSKQD